MRVSRFLTAAGLALMIAVTMSVSSLAQSKTDEDFDKLMKAVGAANGAMRGAAKEQNAAGISAEAAKMVALFKDAEAFWKARNNAEAAEWSASAAAHADGIAKAGADMGAAMGHMKELGGTCQTCHAKYREGAPGSFSIKKG
jgi:cytochrome c556